MGSHEDKYGARILRRLRRIFCSRHPFDPENLGDKARDVAFRVMEDGDIDTCLSFYRANEAAHFPPEVFAQYEAQLRAREFLNLVGMRGGRPVGCCGMAYLQSREGLDVANFCFGMVDTVGQGQGVGTAQVLARIGMLRTTNDFAVAVMYAVPTAVRFYKRFGFDFSCEMPANGRLYPFGVLRASQSFLDDCKAELARRNITCPDVRDRIPRRTSDRT